MSSSNYLFLLLLLLVIPLAALLLKVYAPRITNLRTRVLPRSLHWRAWAPRVFRAPTALEELPRTTTMSEPSSPRRDANDRWTMLIRESEAALEKYLVPEIDIDLASFIRSLTFRVFLVVYLGVDPDTLAFGNVQRITAALSDFYGDGEGESTLPPDIHSILYQWLPHRRFPSSLDRILPAYEALWRIIAIIVVTCEDDETRALRWVMLDFRDNPRDCQYSASFGNDGKSVSAIVDDIVGRLIPIARRPQHATASDWPLSCIQAASWSSSNAPTVEEGLKFAALLASMVIDRIGLHYAISGKEGPATVSQAALWDGRKIWGVNRGPGHLTINVAEIFSHASTSKQVY